MPIKLFTGDSLPIFQFTIKDEDGNVVDLSSPEITAADCYIRAEDAAANLFSDAADINVDLVDLPNGRLDYALPSTGIVAADSYSAQLLLISAGGEQHTERFKFTVESGLKP